MGRKKKKVTRLTEEEYKQYIMRMKDESLAHHTDGQNLTPAQNEESEKKNY